MKLKKCLWVLLSLSVPFLCLTSCQKAKVAPTLPFSVDSVDLEQGKESFNQFSAISGSQILQADGNQLYGPVGPYQLLMLVSEGARGQTREEIYQLLAATPDNFQSLTAFNYQLLIDYQNEQTASIANSVWVEQSLELKQPFEKMAKEQYLAQVTALPFTENPSQSANKIADWVEQQVGADLFDKQLVSESTKLMLLNTLRLDLAWVEPFTAEKTENQLFYTKEQEVEVPFMNQYQKDYHYVRGENYLGSSLELEQGQRLMLILPDKGTDPNQLIDNPEKLLALIKGVEEEAGDVKFELPKFAMTKDLDLISVMKGIGINKLFDETQSELSQLVESSNSLVVDQFKQTNQLEIDEKKVEVKSVTTMGMKEASAPQAEPVLIELTLNRPFIFIIQDQENRPLFMGVIRDPQLKE